MSNETKESRGAVAGRVEQPVRPRAWACVWPEENGCGGGAFTTMDEGSARNYMAGANESADAGRSACRPELVPLYDQAALDAAVAQAVAAVRERWQVLGSLPNAEVLALAPMEGSFSAEEQAFFCGGFRRCAQYLMGPNDRIQPPAVAGRLE